MTRTDLFAAIRPFAPGQKFSQEQVAMIDALADGFGLKTDAVAGAATSAVPDPELIAQLKIDEGCRLTAYKDTVGVWTVGYGHAHVAPGTVWTQAKAEAVLISDVTEHNALLAEKLPWIAKLDPVRRRVLQNMAFNLGIAGLLGFKNTLEYVRTGQYDEAARNMLASKWARQVGNRAVRLAKQMRTGS